MIKILIIFLILGSVSSFASLDRELSKENTPNCNVFISSKSMAKKRLRNIFLILDYNVVTTKDQANLIVDFIRYKTTKIEPKGKKINYAVDELTIKKLNNTVFYEKIKMPIGYGQRSVFQKLENIIEITDALKNQFPECVNSLE